MEPPAETSFSTLPVKLQVEVLNYLNSREIKSAKLVCPYWFRLISLIRPLSFYLNNNNNEHLEILEQSFLSNIGMLVVLNYTETLPIYTSTRCGIPKTKFLKLCTGNSVENIMKLLGIFAKCCEALVILPNSLAKLEPSHLKGLAYEHLRCLDIKFQAPSDDFGNMENRNHLNALTQFFKTTKLPNLQSLVFKYICIIFVESQTWTIRKFFKAADTFLENHGHQLTQLNTLYFSPLITLNAFKHTFNLETLALDFQNSPPTFWYFNAVRDSLKHITTLTSLEFINFTRSVAHPFYSEVMLSILEQNKNSIKKFCFGCNSTRMDWIPIDYELELEEIELRFERFDGNLFSHTTNANQKLKSVTKLYLQVEYSFMQDWMTQITSWMITVFPNLKNLTFECSSNHLNLSDFGLLYSNLVHLRKIFIFPYNNWTINEAYWFTENNHIKFIKAVPVKNGGIQILISRPLPNNIFD